MKIIQRTILRDESLGTNANLNGQTHNYRSETSERNECGIYNVCNCAG